VAVPSPRVNLHYDYDPIYAKYVARTIVKGLIRVDAKDAATFRTNYVTFNRQIDSHMTSWKAQMAPQLE